MERLKRNSAVLLPALLAAASLLTFWPLRHHQFIRYDDVEYILENPHVLTGLSWSNIKWAFSEIYAANWHPLTWISHMLDVQLFGVRPGWHHFISLLLHTGNCLLLFLLLKQLTRSELRGAFVAALFALHPLHVESVAWAAERKDVLSTFWFLLTLLAYSRYVEGRRAPNRKNGPRLSSSWWFFLSVVLYALGLMSKPMLVTVPFLLLLLDFWPLERFQSTVSWHKTVRGCVLEKVPFLVLAAGSCLITVFAQDQSKAIAKGFPLTVRLMNASASYLKYLVKAFWPTDLSIIYPHPALSGTSLWPTALAGAVLLLALSVTAFLLRCKYPWFLVGWFWYVGTLVPVIGILQAGNQAMADRYTYIPLIGIFICVVWGATAALPYFQNARPALVTSGAAVLLACGVATRHQLAYWKSNFALFSHALQVDSRNALAHVNVGADLGEQGKFQEAEDHFKAALSADPRYADAYYYLGITFELQGRLEDARAMLEDGLRLHPGHDLAMSHLGTVLMKLGKTKEGWACLEESVRLNPASFYARSELGRAMAEKGNLDGAAREIAIAIQLKPDDPQLLARLAEIEFKRGRLEQAEELFAALIQRSPNNVQFRLGLAGTLWKKGQPEKALLHFLEAVRLDPQNANARYNLGLALGQQRNYSEAAAQFSEAVRLKPDFQEALTELGRALAAQGLFEQAQIVFQKSVKLCPTNANLQLNLANALMLSGHTNEAREAFARTVEIQPDIADRFIREGEALADRGQSTAAIARLRTGLFLHPGNAEVQSRLAWLLATHPQPGIRDGAEALRLASNALQAGSRKTAAMWAALEVAYAETGDFSKAAETAERTQAVALSEGAAPLAEAAANRVKLYREGKAYHLDASEAR